MESFKTRLGEHPFLTGMPQKYLDVLFGCSSHLHFEPEHVIFRAGGKADRFYLIEEGEIAVELTDRNGDRRTVQILGPGEVLGWSWLVPPHVWQYDAKVRKPVSAIVLEGRSVRARMKQDSLFGSALLQRFMTIILDRLHATRKKLVADRHESAVA